MELTMEDEAVFDAAFSIENKIHDSVQFMYYYHSDSTVRKVLAEDGIRLRLNHVDQFPDKLEGRAIFENERRLVVYVPEKEEICSHLFEKYEEKEKKYLRLNIDKCYLESIAADPKNNRDVTEELYNCLRIRGYGDAIETKDCWSK